MEHVDAVVVGSGFGGSVAAYRLADGGMSVVLLERGRPFPPGSFPRSPSEMGRAFWDPAENLYGMFDVWSFRGCDSVVSSGLGGGSLIYANVLLRKEEDWFVQDAPLPGGGYETWPVTRLDLDPHYDAVEKMIGVTEYPLGHPLYSGTLKTLALRDAAAELGLDWKLAPVAVSFSPRPGADPGPGQTIAEPVADNLHGMPRRTCRLCGECNIGCNEGAKNSLDHTYLSAAKRRGADIRPLHEVRAIRPRIGGGFDVDYVVHMPNDTPHSPEDGKRSPRWTGPHTISCDKLVLAAGTYGTSYLLLKNRASFPGLSDTLGTRFSGNGDLLSFLLRAKDRSRTRQISASHGPVITSTIHLAGQRGAHIQDGGYPAFVDWLVESADLGHEVVRAAKFVLDRLRGLMTHDTNLSAEMSDLIGSGELSSSSLPLLGMGRDVPDGELRLRDGNLDVVWHQETSEDYFDRMRGTMRRIGHVMGADYADSPSWHRRRILTVHPLGGAPMGRHAGEGVCDSFGEVFGFPGLYVADGAAMPGSVGTNPALTIAALADRMCTQVLEARRTAIPVPEMRPVPSVATSLSFTEEMRGFLGLGRTDPRAREGQGDGDRFAFELTITADDVDRFLSDPEHLATAVGWIDADVCGGRRPIVRGWFNLFAPGEAPDRREMRYRLHFLDGEGRPRTLAGYKDVHHGPATRLWLDTSTLYTRLYEGHVTEQDEDDAPILAAGILRILPTDLVHMLGTFETTGPDGLAAIARFGSFFLGQLWDIYRPCPQEGPKEPVST